MRLGGRLRKQLRGRKNKLIDDSSRSSANRRQAGGWRACSRGGRPRTNMSVGQKTAINDPSRILVYLPSKLRASCLSGQSGRNGRLLAFRPLCNVGLPFCGQAGRRPARTRPGGRPMGHRGPKELTTFHALRPTCPPSGATPHTFPLIRQTIYDLRVSAILAVRIVVW